MEVNLNELICPTFRDIAKDIIQCNIGRAILKGGRNSTKSQIVSEAILTGCMLYKQSAVSVIRYSNKIEQRLVDTFRSSIQYMGIERFWKLRKSPFEYVLLDENYRETNVSIRFLGADKPENIRSYRARGGTIFRYIWIEEATNFDSERQMQILLDTLYRGEGKHCIIYTYNPPQRSSNWLNKQFDVPIGKVLGHDSNSFRTEYEFIVNNETIKSIQVIHHSSYLDIIPYHPSWLGYEWIGEAEKAKKENNQFYRWSYLGEVIGTDANVFSNIKDWDGKTDGLDLREVFRGLDLGLGGKDPYALVIWGYDRRNKRIYALDEFYKSKIDTPEVAQEIKDRNKHNFPVFGDSATPILLNQIANKGVNILGAVKGPGSKDAGIKYLQSLNGIYINKYKTPNIYREFSQYEYLTDTEDNITNKIQDSDDHTVDATRYAFSDEIRYD